MQYKFNAISHFRKYVCKAWFMNINDSTFSYRNTRITPWTLWLTPHLVPIFYAGIVLSWVYFSTSPVDCWSERIPKSPTWRSLKFLLRPYTSCEQTEEHYYVVSILVNILKPIYHMLCIDHNNLRHISF